MNRTSLFFAAALLLMLVTESDTQTKLSNYKRVLIFRSSSGAVSGYLTTVEQDTLHVLTTSGEESISRAEITRVIVRAEPRSGQGLGYGMLIGGYAGLYLLGARDESGTFLHSRLDEQPFVILLGLLPGLAVGAGAGYLVDPGSEGSDQLFDINGTAESGQTEWHHLTESLKPRESAKLHISIQGSHLYNFNFSDQFKTDYGREDFSSFNLVRKLQCTYSIMPQLEAGAAVAPFGTMGFNSNRYEYTVQVSSRSLNLNKTLKSTGYYLVAQYKPLSHGLSEQFDLNIGGGIGWMSIDYQRNISVYTYDYSSSTSASFGPFPFTDSRSALSGIIYSEIAMQLYERLTFGIILDRLMVEGLADPGEPSLGYAPSTLNLGTWSLGFNLGVHF